MKDRRSHLIVTNVRLSQGISNWPSSGRGHRRDDDRDGDHDEDGIRSEAEV